MLCLRRALDLHRNDVQVVVFLVPHRSGVVPQQAERNLAFVHYLGLFDMTRKTIRTLKIENFKSIDSLEVKGLAPFSVFAGANGSGKSNFFDALDFVSLFVRGGIEIALREHGGFANIHSAKRYAPNSKKFSFELKCDLLKQQEETPTTFHYSLSIDDLDTRKPEIEEYLFFNGRRLIVHRRGDEEVSFDVEKFPDRFFVAAIHSALSLLPNHPLTELLRNLNVYRIDPTGAKEPDKSDLDPTQLERKGHNLASVLRRLERNRAIHEDILDWMEMIVPGIEKIQTEQQRLDSRTALLFKEKGTRKQFPAHLVSDGTMYALCLLVAVLDTPSGCGMTLIEEPERGLHPKAIRELIDLMRQQASPENPIWLTTHSESVVRALNLGELILVDKVEGRTTMKSADAGNISQEDLAPLSLDEVWLSNLLAGGLP